MKATKHRAPEARQPLGVSVMRSVAGGRRGEDDERAESNGLGRVLALSDGIFAIALTLLVFNLTTRRGSSLPGFSKTLHELASEFQAAAISFVVIGLLWLGHHRLFSHIERVDRVLLQLNLLSLAPVVFMPFAAQLLSEYGSEGQGSIFYATTAAIASLLYLVMWWYAVSNRRLTSRTLGRSAIRRLAVRPLITFMVFGLSIPIALVSASSAHCIWFGLLILLLVVHDRPRSSGSRRPISARHQSAA